MLFSNISAIHMFSTESTKLSHYTCSSESSLFFYLLRFKKMIANKGT